MRILSGVILTLLVLGIGGVAYVYSGLYNIAASDEHAAWGKWIVHTTMHHSVEASAEDISVPNLASNDMIRQGARAYDSLCAVCHLKPGLESTVLRAGLNPMPPTLMDQDHWGPAEQFWIVKHGIKMTSMPAWGETHADEELWEIVAFLQELPELSEQEYNALISSAGSSTGEQADGGHAQEDGHDHEHGDMSGMVGPSSNEPAASQDDGHDHEHGDMSGMMGASTDEPEASHGDDHDHGDRSETVASSESGPAEETPDNESTSSAQGEAEADDHYADGHSH